LAEALVALVVVVVIVAVAVGVAAFACCVYSKILNKLLPHLQLRKSMLNTKIHMQQARHKLQLRFRLKVELRTTENIVDLFVWA